jgi:tetratricopeptide (TPR) repeat protein
VRTHETELRRLAALGTNLRASGDDGRAETMWRAALEFDAADPEALFGLGGLLQLQARYAEAAQLAEKALARNPKSEVAWITLGDSHFNAGRPESAAGAFVQAKLLGADEVGVRIRLAAAYGALGHDGAALAELDEALELSPSNASARFNRGKLRLKARNFAAGWSDYEERWREPTFLARSRAWISPSIAPHLTLAPTTQAFVGRRTLAVGEQGIGDEVMFASMIPDLLAEAQEVTCLPSPRLVRLFTASFPTVTVLNPNGARIDADLFVALGSLGSAFRSSEQSFPGTPFLKSSEPSRERWERRLSQRPARPRIGLAWRGGSAITGSHSRSMPLANLSPILDGLDADFFSLQHGDVAAEIDSVNATVRSPVHAFAPQDLDDCDDLAGLITSLDAVLTVQTAVAHLAGALGKPTLVMLPVNPEWRYTAEGDTMPWYRSVQLLRQTVPGDWASVIERANLRLGQIAHSGATSP